MSLFPSIRIEGGLLGPDVLDQLFSGELPGQRAADFGLDAKRNLTDEIAATFADARALWGVFQRRLERLAEDDLATTVTRDAWVIPFLGLLGYEPRYNQKAFEIDGLTFAISHRASEPMEAPPVHVVGIRQELGRVPASGRPRMAPHSLVQEYLNRTESLWGLVTNGKTLRLLRDCTFVRRQAYVDFDLPAILEEQRFQDFAALYRLLHRTRLPRGADDGDQCLLEKYYAYSLDQGGRVREHLREGVELCLEMLANGFLRHPANDDLRRRVSPNCSGVDRITADDFYRQLLILVYRFLFLLVSEDRGLLSTDPLYRESYGVSRLRRMLDQRGAFSDHDDLWQSLRVLWLVLIRDEHQPSLGNQTMAAILGLAVLNGDLFAPQDLDSFTITNDDFLTAFWRLSWYQDRRTGVSRRVNYAALDVEELGSVYESLLELHPLIVPDHSGRPIFEFVQGGGRKETGSYYTPPELVAELIKSALEPVIGQRLAACTNDSEKERALLAIRVCDPACGSGHFLLAAARRLGKELARIRTGEDEPAPERVRESIREVISHCIYGVDRNPLAVDLCRVALWLESHTSDKPLTFLDHHIRCGDSLVGVFDLNALSEGIPDKAFQPLEGDDKATARELAKRNRDERSGIRDLAGWNPGSQLADLNRQSRSLDAIADDSPEAIRRKKKLFEASHEDPGWLRYKQACDLWTAAFFQPLQPDKPAITTAALSNHLTGRPIDAAALGRASAIASSQRFFHWPLEFPDIFADGGFDVILSNPPWERVKLQEQEFFAARDARIATAANKSARAKLLKSLPETDPELHQEFILALRAAGGASGLMRNSGRFPLTGRGDINTYAVFAELASMSINDRGRMSLVLPRGIATDDTTKVYFGSIVSAGRLVDLVGFENEEFIFPAIDHRVTFCKMTVAGRGESEQTARIAFYIRRFSQLADEHRFFSLTKDDFWLLNPNTGNCPIFRTRADAELTKAIYRRVPILWREGTEASAEENCWRLAFNRMFDMANDSHHFRVPDELQSEGYRLEGNVYVSPFERYLPLYEAKMLHQFDHRFSTYEGATEKQLNVGILPQPTPEQKRDPSFVVQPRYWVREEVAESAFPKYPEPLATALMIEHRPSIQRVLSWWAAGFHLVNGNDQKAANLLMEARRADIDKSVARTVNLDDLDRTCRDMQEAFPISESDAAAVAEQFDAPEELARELVDRFSPKWFMGWRDVCRANDERTLIASAVPRVPVGHKFQLLFSMRPGSERISLLALLNSFVVDYCARQKLGGTSFSYFVMRQLPILSPGILDSVADDIEFMRPRAFLTERVLELCYSSQDIAAIGRDYGCHGSGFGWDDERRFMIRCELDAAVFHLYLRSATTGEWRRADNEAADGFSELQRQFAMPRDAVAFILDQFPTTRQKEEQAHGTYRTKDRILEIYDAMQSALRAGKLYESPLDPPPGRHS